MAGLDIAAGYRPATPVNKKRRTYIDEAQNILGRTGEGVDPLSEGALDIATADFRGRRSARDLMANRNVGSRPGGESINPMMPGAAGMGTGPSNTNYGGQGAKTNWFINQENARNTGFTDNEWLSSKGPMKQVLKPNEVPREGIAYYTPTELATGAMNREAYAGRKAAQQSDARGLITANASQEAAGRRARIEDRKNGPNQEQQLMAMAARGNPAALRMLGMVAEGNLATNVEGMRGRNGLDIAKLQFGEKPAPSEAIQRQGLMEMYGANGGEAVYGDMDEFIERGLRGGAGGLDIASGGKTDPVGSAMFGAKLSPTQSRQLQEVAAGGDENAVFRFLQGLGLSDDEVNEAANAAMGSSFRSITNPGGWRNALRTTTDEFWNNPAGARRRLDISRRSP